MLQRITEDEIPVVVGLMNAAYRSTDSTQSWNTETGILDGVRTTEAALRREIEDKPQGAMLVWKRDDEIVGCVWVEPVGGDGTWYLGSLAVRPTLQQEGLGRSVLAAAEAWIAAHGGLRVEMTVLNVRTALLEWYARRGYWHDGEVKAFPYGDNRFGVPLRDDLSFLVLTKTLA